MGVRGAKPSIEKALTERPVFVPTGARSAVARPSDLSEEAGPIWDIVIDDLVEMGIFKPADVFMLTEVCEMLAEARRLRKSLDNPDPLWPRFERELSREDANELMEDPDRQAQAWPMSGGYKRIRTAYLQTMRTLKSYSDEFAMSPVARLRLGLLTLQGQGLAELMSSRDDDSDVTEAPTLLGEWTDAG